MQNLDFECAALGRELAREADEKLLTDALGVLEEQGVYAFFLYLKAREKNQDTIYKKCWDFLKKTPHGQPLLSQSTNNNNVFDELKSLANQLDDLLFARDLLRQTLIYARYHVKAQSEAGK